MNKEKAIGVLTILIIGWIIFSLYMSNLINSNKITPLLELNPYISYCYHLIYIVLFYGISDCLLYIYNDVNYKKDSTLLYWFIIFIILLSEWYGWILSFQNLIYSLTSFF